MSSRRAARKIDSPSRMSISWPSMKKVLGALRISHGLTKSLAVSSDPRGSASARSAADWARPGRARRSRRRASASPVRSADSTFHGPCAISLTAFSVPARHGVHWPQLSSSKNFIRLSATAFMSSLSDRMTTACEPTKPPCGSKRAEIERMVGELGREDAAGRAAGQKALQRMAIEHAAGIFVDQFVDGDAGGRDLDAGILHAAGDREAAEAFAVAAALAR